MNWSSTSVFEVYLSVYTAMQPPLAVIAWLYTLMSEKLQTPQQPSFSTLSNTQLQQQQPITTPITSSNLASIHTNITSIPESVSQTPLQSIISDQHTSSLHSSSPSHSRQNTMYQITMSQSSKHKRNVSHDFLIGGSSLAIRDDFGDDNMNLIPPSSFSQQIIQGQTQQLQQQPSSLQIQSYPEDSNFDDDDCVFLQKKEIIEDQQQFISPFDNNTLVLDQFGQTVNKSPHITPQSSFQSKGKQKQDFGKDGQQIQIQARSNPINNVTQPTTPRQVIRQASIKIQRENPRQVFMPLRLFSMRFPKLIISLPQYNSLNYPINASIQAALMALAQLQVGKECDQKMTSMIKDIATNSNKQTTDYTLTDFEKIGANSIGIPSLD
ncbi:MAG: hypothetical protein EZS28_041727, partial [Streblomastix strix]